MNTRLLECKHGTFLMPTYDQIVTGSLENYGEYSEPEVDLFKQFIRPGDIVIEGGANLGALTVPLAQMVGPQGRVIAFEPQPMICKIMVANIAMNNLGVEARTAALGASKGRCTIPNFADYNFGYNYGRVEINSIPDIPCFEVELTTLDSIDVPSCRFIKLDIEGEEEHALEGGKEFIVKHKPIMFVENDRKGKAEHLAQVVRDLGYTPYWHVSFLFNPNNHNKNENNIFANQASFNMLCVPADGPNVITVHDFTLVDESSFKIILPCLND